jgi:integrase
VRHLAAFKQHVPIVSRRAMLGGREGLTQEKQERLLSVVHPDSPENPWERGFVRKRNWLIVVLLLSTGMRRGELLGLQIRDIDPHESKIRILRRADALDDPRREQPNAKTRDREAQLSLPIMKLLWDHITQDRAAIRASAQWPQVIVSDEGEPLSLSSITKMFELLREACPGLPSNLTSHVMRHTWNERFSEQAESMGLSEAVVTKVRNESQGWTPTSKMEMHYRRQHIKKTGNRLNLKVQEGIDAQLGDRK